MRWRHRCCTCLSRNAEALAESSSLRVASRGMRGEHPDKMCAAIVEQHCLLGRADQRLRKCPRFESSVFIEFAEMRHRLLNHATPDADTAHQSLVAMHFAVLLASRVAQVHVRYQNSRRRKRKHPKSALHAEIRTARNASA